MIRQYPYRMPIRFALTFAVCGMALMVKAQGLSAPLSGGNSTPPAAGSNPSLPFAGNSVATPINVPIDYRVDTGDVLQIDVARHGDVTRAIRLLADAKIRLPRLVQPIPARGKTCSELVDEITKQLTAEGKLVLRPGQVSVSVVEMRIRRVFVRGNVGRSGDFDLKNGWRVTELYAVIGGVPNPERVTAKILNPLRPGPLNVNLNQALLTPDSGENIPLMEGDTLILEGPRAKRLFVKGEGPRGTHELDERFSLRQALIQLGYSTNGATGDVRHARLYRHTAPGDPTSPQTTTTVNLLELMTNDNAPDIALQDMDTLDIPISQRFIYLYGEINAPRKVFLREDQPTYLVDVMGFGGTTGRAKIDDVKVMRMVDGKPNIKSYKFGKFLANGDLKQNPEILPQDIVFVPDVKRPDVINNVWTAWGLFGIVQAVLPGTRIR